GRGAGGGEERVRGEDNQPGDQDCHLGEQGYRTVQQSRDVHVSSWSSARPASMAGQLAVRSTQRWSRCKLSTSTVSRARKMVSRMANPTAASAAATVMLRKTNTCPPTSLSMRA